MIAHRAIAIALLVAVAATVAVIALSGADAYRVRLELSTATGLRQGSEVKLGGVPVGTVRSLHLGHGDVVVADLDIDEGGGRVGPDASARIVTSNLLGSKFVQLDPGDVARAQPSGTTTIAASRVSQPVDLDQVLNVLDPDTRTRLQILINEAGAAFTGRAQDFNETLRLLPPSLADGARMLGELNADNRSLASLVRHSSDLVQRLTADRRDLSRVITAASGVMTTTAQRQAALMETLERAPQTLRTARRFLDDLKATTLPLGPAARAISATAPALTDTLSELPSFRSAAAPTLDEAVDIAPALTRLGTRATPVLRSAKPTLNSAATFAVAAAPLTKTLRVSADDALGLVEGWARSIQTRDPLGHVFRGRAVVGLETLRSLVARLVPASSNAKSNTPGRVKKIPALKLPIDKVAPARPKPSSAANPIQDLKNGVGKTLDKVVDGVGKVLGQGNGATESSPQPSPGNPAKNLLEYLLGP